MTHKEWTQQNLALRLKERIEANGHLAGGEGTGVFARLTSRIVEAQHVLKLALEDGHFDDITASDIEELGHANEVFHERLRAAALDLLAGQYPELDVQVRFGTRYAFERFAGETDVEYRARVKLSLMRGGVMFRVFNRGVGR